jgi:hypothetical protein
MLLNIGTFAMTHEECKEHSNFPEYITMKFCLFQLYLDN